MKSTQMSSVKPQPMSACFGPILPNMNHVKESSCVCPDVMGSRVYRSNPIPSVPQISVSKGPFAKCVVFIPGTLIVIVIIY